MTTEPKNQVQIWAFETHDVRIHDRDGNPWFVAVDVCKIWGIKNSRDAVARLEDDEKDTVVIADSIGRDREVQVISESGLYAMAARSRMDAPKRFCKWVRSDVLPSIRKTGSYTVPGIEPPPVVQSNPVLEKILEILAQGHVETKARIHDIEETQSEHSKRIEHLEKVAPPEDYLTLVAFARWKGLGRLTANDLMSWGGKLKSYCRSRGIETIPIPDLRWGKVNAYPVQVITETFDRFGPKR